MGFLDKLLGRKTRVGPKILAYAMVALAVGNVESLRKELADGSDDQWENVAREFLRAYFALASMRAGRCIRDMPSLNRFGAGMLDVLRLFPEEDGGELIRPAFTDELAVDYCVRLYVHGDPDEDDSDAVQDCAEFLGFDLQHPYRMLLAYAHIRTMRILGIGKCDIRFLRAWILNSSSFITASKEILNKLKPVPSPSGVDIEQ